MSSYTLLSKINVRRFAKDLAEATTSNGRRLDAGALAQRLWKATRRCVLCELVED
jgi:hypothetical protein